MSHENLELFLSAILAPPPGRERTTIRWLLSAADFNMPFRASNINSAGSHPDSAEVIPAPTPTRIHMEQDYSYGQITR
jgi:hypothetical protein